MIFKCKHPFSRLAVDKKTTVKFEDADFQTLAHHLMCNNCGERLDLYFAICIDGAKTFLNKKPEKSKS